MTDSSEAVAVSKEPEQVHGLLAEYETPQKLIAAARRIKDAGYSRWDSFSPFPVHGLDPAMGIRPTILPWIVFAAGLSGGCGALFFQWWTSTRDYPWIVSGKPFWSIPANIPIAFELTILFSALSAFFGMLALNGLPLLYHWVFEDERFKRATSDRYFLSIESSDPKFDLTESRALLESTDSIRTEIVWETDENAAGADAPTHELTERAR